MAPESNKSCSLIKISKTSAARPARPLGASIISEQIRKGLRRRRDVMKVGVMRSMIRNEDFASVQQATH